MNSNTLLNILLVMLCIAGVFLIFMVALAFFAIRWLQRFLSPDSAEMRRELDQLRASNPDLGNEDLVRKIIRQQAIRCGIVGAITGIGGFITLPVALPVDILASMRIQAVMVQFISMIYSRPDANSGNMQLQTSLVMSGTVELTETTTSVIMRFVARLLGESLAIMLPVVGVAVGFIVNYAIAAATGNMAMRWYAGHSA